jgi:hypothetical protein
MILFIAGYLLYHRYVILAVATVVILGVLLLLMRRRGLELPDALRR